MNDESDLSYISAIISAWTAEYIESSTFRAKHRLTNTDDYVNTFHRFLFRHNKTDVEDNVTLFMLSNVIDNQCSLAIYGHVNNRYITHSIINSYPNKRIVEVTGYRYRNAYMMGDPDLRNRITSQIDISIKHVLQTTLNHVRRT